MTRLVLRSLPVDTYEIAEKEYAMPVEMHSEHREETAWTVMLFMAAATNDRTEHAAINDLLELQKVDTEHKVNVGNAATVNVETRDKVNVVVQIDRQWPGYAERYCIQKDESRLCETVPGRWNTPRLPRDTGESQALAEFVDWAEKCFPARRYLLILWGHAFGLGFGRDNGDALTIPEIAAAVNGRNIDILGTNACAMSYAEAVYQLRNGPEEEVRGPKFLIASEITIPFAGWPYQEVLEEIVKCPDIEPKELGKRIVDLFMDSYSSENVALTLLDLSKARELGEPLKTLAQALGDAIDRGGAASTQIRDAFLDTARGDVRPLVDLFDLCQRLTSIKDAGTSDVRAAANAMLGDPKDPNKPGILEPGNDRFIVKHRKDPELDGLHGLGIYAPSLTNAADLKRLELDDQLTYRTLALMKDNRWQALVYKDLRNLLDPVIAAVSEFVNGSGATTADDRAGVTQLFVGIYRSFERLGEALDGVHEAIKDVLPNRAYDFSRISGYQPALSARFGSPYLRLASDLHGQYVEQAAHTAMLFESMAAKHESNINPRMVALLDRVADSLHNLESELANVERTTEKVVTHAKFGVGDDDSKPGVGVDDRKSGLGDDDSKPGVGDDDTKPGVGDDDSKPGVGPLSWLFTRDGGDIAARTAGVSAAELFAGIARSLQQLEQSVSKLENTARAVLTTPRLDLNDEVYRTRATEAVNLSVRHVREFVRLAKRTTAVALAHPVHGLGPDGQAGIGAAGRQQLAAAAGLSPRVLKLF
jgi:hypothetical protein